VLSLCKSDVYTITSGFLWLSIYAIPSVSMVYAITLLLSTARIC